MKWRSRRRASAHKSKSYRVSPRRLRLLRNPEKPQTAGVFFFLEQPLKSGSTLDLLLTLPSEITRGEPVRVRCQARPANRSRRRRPGGDCRENRALPLSSWQARTSQRELSFQQTQAKK